METKQLKSQGVALESTRIDAELGILYDVVMCAEGEAKGHYIHLEAEFIEDLVAYDQKHFAKNGLKCRFGHPSMCNDPLGTQAGFFKNFRTKEIEVSQGSGKKKKKVMQAIADLHLLEASNNSPTHPKMREYILEMATESPEFIMTSIVFGMGKQYQRDENGEKRYIDTFDEKTQKWVYEDSAYGDLYVEFSKHFYTDIVEAGAATDSLFSAQFNQDSFAVQAITWLNENPKIKEFINKNPEKVQDFLSKTGIFSNTIQKNETMSYIKKMLGVVDDSEVEAKMLELDNKIAQLAKDKKDADEVAYAAQLDVIALKEAAKDSATALATANTEIERLKALAAAVPTPAVEELELAKPSTTPIWDAKKLELAGK